MSEQQKRALLLNSLTLLAVGGWALFGVRVALPLLAPFVAGLCIAFALKPVICFLSNMLRLRRRRVALAVLGLFYLLLALGLWAAGVGAALCLRRLALALPRLYREQWIPLLADLFEALSGLIHRLTPNAAQLIHTWFQRVSGLLGELATTLSSHLMAQGTQLASKVPLFLMTLLFTVVCSVMISMDYQRVASFLARQLPASWRGIFFDCKDFMVCSLWRMARAYALLLLLTFAQLAVGFWLLGVQNPLGLGLAIALLDLLPLIGTGGVLIPWGLWELLRGSLGLGGGLLLLYGVLSLVRNLLEPKLVGDTIGLPPLVTVTAMYAGMRLLGFWGLFLAPLTALLLCFLHRRGRLSLYRE